MRTTPLQTLLLLLVGLSLVSCTPARRSGGGGGGDDDDNGDDDDSAQGDDDDNGDDDDSVGDDDDSTDGPCPNIISVDPEADATNVFATRVTVTWDAVPQNGNVTLADGAGAAVSGSVSDDDNGRTLIFTPSGALAAGTTFEVTASQDCTSDATYTFTTGPFGDPVSPQTAVINRAYNLDLGGATFTEPPGVGALLQGFLVDTYLIIQPTDDSDLPAGDMHVMGGMGELDGGDIIQDTCAETLNWTTGPDNIVGTADDNPADWNNPLMTLEADQLTFNVQGVATIIEDLTMTALFAPDASSYVGGIFEGTIDTRGLNGLVDSEDPNAICDLVQSTVGVSCVDCGGGEMYCLDVAAEDVSGTWLSNLSGGLTPRSCADIIDDNACDNDAYTTDGENNGPIDPSLCPEWVP